MDFRIAYRYTVAVLHDLGYFENEIINKIEIQNVELKNQSKSIDDINKFLNVLNHKIAFYKFTFWVFFAFVVISFCIGFGLHWFITK